MPASTLKNQRDSDLTDPTFTSPVAVSFQSGVQRRLNGMHLSGAHNVNTASKSFIGDSCTRFSDRLTPGKIELDGAPQGTNLARRLFWNTGVADFHHWSGSCESLESPVPRGFHD